MEELQPRDFGQLSRLQQEVRNRGFSSEFGAAVLEEHNPGRVFADRLSSPTAALVWSASGYCFFLGDYRAEAFLQKLPEVLFNQLDHRVMRLITYSPEATERLKSVLAPTVAQESIRLVYWVKTSRLPPARQLPRRVSLVAVEGERIGELFKFKPFI